MTAIDQPNQYIRWSNDHLVAATAASDAVAPRKLPVREVSAQFASVNRVLIVDDDPQILRLLEQVSRRMGYDVIKANSIETAPDPVAVGAALMLLDLQLGSQDGLALVDRLSVAKSGTPIVLMSGCDPRLLTMAEQACKEHDCIIAGVLPKPFDMSALEEILLRHRRVTAASARDNLAAAIRNRDILPHYQPIMDLQTGGLAGAEALVRWQHAERGLLSPMHIVPQAEEAGLMHELTHLMLEQALKDWARLPVDLRNMRVAVNVSPSVLIDDHLVVKVAELLKAFELSAESLTLEITESVSLLDIPKIRTALCRLRLAGIDLSLDDFGTGYSSLLALRDLPFNKVKLDRAFVTDADGQPEQLTIAASVTRLAHDLNLQIVGEGIETQQCFDLSRQIGMDYGQGFLIAKPMGYEEFTAYSRMSPTKN